MRISNKLARSGPYTKRIFQVIAYERLIKQSTCGPLCPIEVASPRQPVVTTVK